MKKNYGLAIATLTSIVCLFSACGNEKETDSTQPEATQTTTVTSTSVEQTTTKNVTTTKAPASEGAAFDLNYDKKLTKDDKLRQEISQLVEKAIPRTFSFQYKVDFEMNKDGTYQPAKTKYHSVGQFNTPDDLRPYCYEIFEKSFADNLLKNCCSTEERDNKKHYICGSDGRGANIFYKGYDVIPVSMTDSEMKINVVALYQDSNSTEPVSDKNDFNLKLNSDGKWCDKKGNLYNFPYKYTIKQNIFTLKKIEGQWKFTSFDLWY